jgi:hypothetical protein
MIVMLNNYFITSLSLRSSCLELNNEDYLLPDTMQPFHSLTGVIEHQIYDMSNTLYVNKQWYGMSSELDLRNFHSIFI